MRRTQFKAPAVSRLKPTGQPGQPGPTGSTALSFRPFLSSKVLVHHKKALVRIIQSVKNNAGPTAFAQETLKSTGNSGKKGILFPPSLFRHKKTITKLSWCYMIFIHSSNIFIYIHMSKKCFSGSGPKGNYVLENTGKNFHPTINPFHCPSVHSPSPLGV